MATPQNSGSASLRAEKSTEIETSHTPSALTQGKGPAVQSEPAGPDANQSDANLQAAITEAGEHPERAAALAADLNIGAAVEPQTSTEIASEENEDGEDKEPWEKDPDYDLDRFWTLSNTEAKAYALECGADERFLRNLVLAFCTAEDRPEGENPDITPRPLMSGRGYNGLMFTVESEAFSAPTLTGWVFRKDDVLDVDINQKDSFLHGEVVLAVVDSNLVLLELRETGGETRDGDDLLRFFDLRTGKSLRHNAHLIIGFLSEVHRRYRRPESSFDRAYKKVWAQDREDRKTVKGGGYEPSGYLLNNRLERAMAEEDAAEARALAEASLGNAFAAQCGGAC